MSEKSSEFGVNSAKDSSKFKRIQSFFNNFNSSITSRKSFQNYEQIQEIQLRDSKKESKNSFRHLFNSKKSNVSKTKLNSLIFFLILILSSTCCVLPSEARTTNRRPHMFSRLPPSRHYVELLPELRPNEPEDPLQDNRIFFQNGYKREDKLPICEEESVCTRLNTYATPYAVRLCRCRGKVQCTTSMDTTDGYTISDKNNQFKMCNPVQKIPECRLYRDNAYTKIFYHNNSTQMLIHCSCPKNSLSYMASKRPKITADNKGYFFNFHCSPLDLPCGYKEPCRYFTVNKKTYYDDVTTNVGCYCPPNNSCPQHHKDPGVIPEPIFSFGHLTHRTYNGYCMEN